MARIMAIDYGLKRVGIAVSDPSQIIASPLTTVNTSEIKTFLQDYLSKEQVEKIIIGLPYRADGTLPPFAKKIEQFANWLKSTFPSIKIEFYDERYTSKLATYAMIEAGYKKKKRQQKENIDKMAAAIMLQEYLGNI